jgi:hypothetical protein
VGEVLRELVGEFRVAVEVEIDREGRGGFVQTCR